jgi:hypothetical protein
VARDYTSLAELTIWAIEARYPADMPEVLPRDAQEALRTATSIVQLMEVEIASQ